ncbi:MAG: DUF4240 domain-containing protein [Phormidesmis sp.]
MQSHTEREFWEIIEQAGNPNTCSPRSQCQAMVDALKGSSREELAWFSNTHFEMLDKLYTWTSLKACYVVLGYTSDDVFEDFRNWIILHGKNRFYKTIDDPEVIADYAHVQDPIEEINGEPLLYVCQDAWSGDIEELESTYRSPKDCPFPEQWPTQELLMAEFPKLAMRFRFGNSRDVCTEQWDQLILSELSEKFDFKDANSTD